MIGFGALNLSPEQFGRMRIADFFLKLFGYREEEEIKQRQLAELVRLQTVELINIQLEKKNRIKKPSELWQFPWEKVEIKQEQITEKEQVQRFTRLLKTLKNE